MAWTSASDVINSWIGGGAPTDTNLVDSWIARAERLIRREVPDLQARLDVEADVEPESTELLETTKDVVVEMVTDLFRNPEGRRSTQLSTGPFQESVTFGGDNPGKLLLTGDQLSRLRGVGLGQRAFTIDMIPSTSPYSPFYSPEAWPC